MRGNRRVVLRVVASAIRSVMLLDFIALLLHNLLPTLDAVKLGTACREQHAEIISTRILDSPNTGASVQY